MPQFDKKNSTKFVNNLKWPTTQQIKAKLINRKGARSVLKTCNQIFKMLEMFFYQQFKKIFLGCVVLRGYQEFTLELTAILTGS